MRSPRRFWSATVICLGLLTACGTGSDRATSPSEPTATEPPSAEQTVTSTEPETDPTTIPTTVATTPAPTLPPATSPPATAPSQPLMPDVMCMNLQDAQDLIQTVGVFYSRSVDATGQGRDQIVDSNWLVVGQTPDVGTPFGEGDALLAVVKIGEQPNPC